MKRTLDHLDKSVFGLNRTRAAGKEFMADDLVRVEHISKSFSGVAALDDVRFDLRSGEVHALLGENGAGKSTLMKIISGVYTRDSGDFYVNGVKITGDLTPQSAQKLGIGIIHQELNLCPHLTVAENIFLNREFTVSGFLKKNRTRRLNSTLKP
jgi:ribose transport system ATP-binding protein